jgi:NAD(P)-dependent dehydrogenase (short-subunit alcohol dehydrogenase family)
MMTPRGKTEDGLESQMGVNYFGHFLLTGLLLPLMESIRGSRIVALSSIAHKNGKIDFENLNAERSYSKMGAYGQSKLACLMFSYELQRRLAAAKSKTISVAAHPGVSFTELGRHLPSFVQFIAPYLSFMSHSVESGAQPTLLAALSPDAKGGDFFGPTGFREMKGEAGKVNSTNASHDEQTATRLWEESEKITGFSYLSAQSDE